MPELPEVETIKNELAPALIGRCFADITVLDTKAIREPSPEEFRTALLGRTIETIQRRGKYLLLRLSTQSPGGCFQSTLNQRTSVRDRIRHPLQPTLVIHLKMSGALLLNTRLPHRFGKVLFHLDDGNHVLFTDPRRFGRMWVVNDPERIIAKLGPEPFDPNFTPNIFQERLLKHKTPIKAVLLDQGILAGVGNMYADEALFAARIHPEQLANELSPRKAHTLYKAIRKVLTNAIASKGASTREYIRPDGTLGNAHQTFAVAHRRGEVCPDCHTPIKRITVRNRGTYFCPRCQELR